MIELNTNIPKGTKDWDKLINQNFKTIQDTTNNFSNPNLLINGDFQICQRGINFTLSNYFMYTCDRWCVWAQSNGQSININNDGITLNSHGDESIMQMVENPKINKGKEMTFSVMLNIPIGSSVQIRVDQTVDNTIIGSSKNRVEKTYNGTGKYEIATLSVPTNSTNNDYIRVLISTNNDCNGKQIKVKYSKLELGTFATPFVPRHYGEEFALCQRYYRKTPYQQVFRMSYYINDLVVFEYPIGVDMRTTPTIIGKPNIDIQLATLTGSNIEDCSFTITKTSNGLTIGANKTNHGATDGILVIKNSCAFDSEIY